MSQIPVDFVGPGRLEVVVDQDFHIDAIHCGDGFPALASLDGMFDAWRWPVIQGDEVLRVIFDRCGHDNDSSLCKAASAFVVLGICRCCGFSILTLRWPDGDSPANRPSSGCCFRLSSLRTTRRLC